MKKIVQAGVMVLECESCKGTIFLPVDMKLNSKVMAYGDKDIVVQCNNCGKSMPVTLRQPEYPSLRER